MKRYKQRDALVSWYKLGLTYCCYWINTSGQVPGIASGKKQVLFMFAGTSWCSDFREDGPFLLSGCFAVILHTILWVMSAVGLRPYWLMQMQCCLSLDAASTHLMHSSCLGITVKVIYQSQAPWEFSPHLNGIAPFFISYITKSTSGLTPFTEGFNSILQGASIPLQILTQILQPLPPMAWTTAEHACVVLADMHL